jgi:hypothetical protein
MSFPGACYRSWSSVEYGVLLPKDLRRCRALPGTFMFVAPLAHQSRSIISHQAPSQDFRFFI